MNLSLWLEIFAEWLDDEIFDLEIQEKHEQEYLLHESLPEGHLCYCFM